MVNKTSAVVLGALIFLLTGASWAQQKPEEIPDAPSASRPVPPPALPTSRPADQDTPDSSSVDEPPPPPPANEAPAANREAPHSAPDEADQKIPPPPMPPVNTVTTAPEGSVSPDAENAR